MNKITKDKEFTTANEHQKTSGRQRSIAIIWKLLRMLKSRYILSVMERKLQRHYATFSGQSASSRDPVVTIQCVENIFYFCLFGEIIRELRKQGPIRVDQIVIRSLIALDGNSPPRSFFRKFLRKLIRKLHTNRVADHKWVRLFGAYTDRVAYRSAPRLSYWLERKIAKEADQLWKGVATKDDLVAMCTHNISIGDLVADSYLRFRPSAVIDLNDTYLRTIIAQALREIYKSSAYFRRVRPALFLTTYTSYVQHGVPARVAAHLGIRVQSFGNYQDFTKLITPESPFHQRQFDHYHENFLKLEDQDQKIAEADNRLAARLGGSIDESIVYMRASNYGNSNVKIPDVKDAAIIFLHDFYDSPHAYQWMAFHDFWEWVCFTIEAFREVDAKFFLKPHPNQVAENEEDLRRLRRMYPSLDILPTGVSNRQLVDSGMSCAVTVYGTVASEMAYMGVPTINCADNPHISFEFGDAAKTKLEYKHLLQNHLNLPRDEAKMRHDACAFYYMHAMHLPAQEASIRNKFVRYNILWGDANKQHLWNFDDIISGFASIGGDDGFKHLIDDFQQTIKNPKTWRDMIALKQLATSERAAQN